MFLRRAAESIPSRSLFKLTPQTFCSFAAAAFDGMEKVIEKRIGSSSLGFGAEIRDKEQLQMDNLMEKVIHQDLVKFGLIPELVGRLPVITGLQSLTKESLVRILTEPKNAILKQYKKLFEMDRVQLEFEDGGHEAIAELTLERSTGARGLRSIMEKLLTPLMYELPSDYTVAKVTVTADMVKNGVEPLIEKDASRKPNKLKPTASDKSHN